MSVVDLIGIINFTTPLNNVDEKATECTSLGDIVNGPETRGMYALSESESLALETESVYLAHALHG